MKSNAQLLLQSCSKQLTRGEEESLFRRLGAARRTIASLEGKVVKRTSAESSQLGVARKQFKHITEILVTANLPLVVKMATKFEVMSVSRDELISDGMLKLLQCIEGFNYELGFKFSTYLTRSLARFFGRSISKEMKHRTGRVDDEEEIMREQQTANDFDPEDGGAIDGVLDLRDMIFKNKAELSELELLIICHRNGIGGKEPKTFQEVQQIVGNLTRGRIQQIHAAAIEKLKTTMVKEQS